MLSILLSSLSLLPQQVNRRAVLGGTAACWMAPSVPASAAAQPVSKAWTLAKGVAMPTLALNTAGLTAAGSDLALREAAAAGIMHVDFHPGIERDGVAKALGSLDRSSLFLTTKIRKPPVGTAPEAAGELVQKQLDEDLKVLGVDSVDMLMLRDSPDPAVMQAQWAGMEAVLAAQKTRAVAVINYCEGSLRTILATAKTPPALNYIMQHVGAPPPPGPHRRTVHRRPLPPPGPQAALLETNALMSAPPSHSPPRQAWGPTPAGCGPSARSAASRPSRTARWASPPRRTSCWRAPCCAGSATRTAAASRRQA